MNWTGVMPAMTTAFQPDFSVDHATVAQNYADTGRVLRIMKSPLAIQLQLFEPVDWSPETRAALEGELAGRRGDPIEQNPNTPGSPAFQAYDAAWRKGQRAMAEQTLGR